MTVRLPPDVPSTVTPRERLTKRLFKIVGAALSRTSIPVPFDAPPQIVLLTSRPKGTAPAGAPVLPASPANKIPTLPGLAITLLTATAPATRPGLLRTARFRTVPGFGRPLPASRAPAVMLMP